MSTDILAERAKRRRWLKIAPAFRTPLAITGVSIALIWLVIAIFAPVIAPHDPLAQAFDRLQPPSAEHLFGTDAVGRDVLSRVVSGARISMPLALSLVVASMVVGGTLGAIAGYFGKVVDEVIMRIADLVFAFPTIILAMVITAALGPSLTNAVIAMLIVSWPAYARADVLASAVGAHVEECLRSAGCRAMARSPRSAATSCRTCCRRYSYSRCSTLAQRSCCSPG